ncbi:putative bifunctional diguanylate cyclase/phosphodiesterase [Mesorhizobium sp. SP-1A]|uniref:putative bifunctional diguanylate cyclase/phosphodiesterase n=1 Tax=Mesorhizobium sp. SP-1A TaxID=3077840 RepID=UPI0028F6F024|nr:EAL domain-containing protein [Mesorhizobium sp. SP-1A]
MYFILVVNSWMLAASFWHQAPFWLTFYVSSGLTVVCGLRLAVWWRSQGKLLTPARAKRELRRLPIMTAILAVAFTSWAIALFPYGDEQAKGHVVFYLTISLISTMFCLIHGRYSALILAAIAGTSVVLFLLWQDSRTSYAIALNITLVTVASAIVIRIQSRDFIRMVNAQTRTAALSDENFILANLDSLTKLPNRRAFFSRLDVAYNQAERTNTRLALGVIDLDGFKPVNDLYGHTVGDRLLVEVATRLESSFCNDTLIFARLGGDEFAFIITDAADNDTLRKLGSEICAALGLPFVLPEATVQISGSIGVAVYPEMATSPAQLYEHADYALYHGKATQRGTAMLFSAQHEQKLNREARIEQTMKFANLDTELSVVFQPIVDMHSRKTLGFEALARWESPLIGNVSPTQFIPIAERAGIIGSLTRPLLRKALTAAATWPEGLRLSFNLSAHDLNTPENVLAVIAIIETGCFDPRRLDLEITETAFLHDFELVRQSIEMLRLMGCGVSLDDFGTGYSSFSRLHALPLTKIKIDRSFISGIDRNPTAYKIVKSLLALSRDMNLECIVEGVETHGEADALRTLGKVMAQGYFYSPPIAATAAADFACEGAAKKPSSHP